MPTSAHYQGSRGAAYHESQKLVDPQVRARLAAVKIEPHLAAPERIVDFGCGDGSLLAMLSATERIGVDAIAENRATARARGVDVRAYLSEIPTAWADAVISHHALEHTLQPLQELQAMRRVLRPGGTLVLYVPADDWRVNRRYEPDERNHHLYTWTPVSLGHLLAEAGFLVQVSQMTQRALPGRATVPLERALPPRAFDWVMLASPFLTRQREILAVASCLDFRSSGCG